MKRNVSVEGLKPLPFKTRRAEAIQADAYLRFNNPQDLKAGKASSAELVFYELERDDTGDIYGLEVCDRVSVTPEVARAFGPETSDWSHTDFDDPWWRGPKCWSLCESINMGKAKAFLSF